MAKITIERDGCISCGACWGICPTVYEENTEDAKSQIVSEFQEDGNLAEGNVEEDLEDCAQQGADSCPVQVIFVE
jgi:ferredoxin